MCKNLEVVKVMVERAFSLVVWCDSWDIFFLVFVTANEPDMALFVDCNKTIYKIFPNLMPSSMKSPSWQTLKTSGPSLTSSYQCKHFPKLN